MGQSCRSSKPTLYKTNKYNSFRMNFLPIVCVITIAVACNANPTTTTENTPIMDSEDSFGPPHPANHPSFPVGLPHGARVRRATLTVTCRQYKYKVNLKSSCDFLCSAIEYPYFYYDYPSCECCY